MIFEAESEQITHLSSIDLVRLMRLLLLAEARLADVPLRAATVPMQITVPDGGDDGRVEWSNGVSLTDYFPSRLCIFQSKAQKITESSLRAEVLKNPRDRPKKAGTKKSKKISTKIKPSLSPALTEVLSRKGAYIVFCSKPIVTTTKTKLVDAIRTAMRTAGANPDRLAAIEIYDANKIADWVNVHPSVALWLAEHERRRSLSGFQTYESWGKGREIHGVAWIDDQSKRFTGFNLSPVTDEAAELQNQTWTFSETATEISQRLAKDHQSIRITGPSGFGKSRFAFEVFNRGSTIADQLDRASVIYADHSLVGDEVAKLAMQIAEQGAASILVVDECPDQVHLKLASIVQRTDSKLRVVTLDVETKILQADDTLTIQLEPASEDMISAIAKSVDGTLSDGDTRFIQELSNGFPRMAVIAAKQRASGKSTLRSVDQLLDRIIWGRRASDADAQRALETLSLFEWMPISGRLVDQTKAIAESLAGSTAELFIERVKSFKGRGIVAQRGNFVEVQPIPLAARLAANRWSILSSERIVAFFQTAAPGLQESMLRRIRWLDEIPEAKLFARAMLAPKGYGNLDALSSDVGAQYLDRLVHVDPDFAISTLLRVFGALSIDELRAVDAGRRYIVWALEKLVFRKDSFSAAATLLRRFAAAETEDHLSNSASGQFKQLYQLYLSGTQAPPAERLLILDEGLTSSDAAERNLSFEALVEMLRTGHFSRGGGAEEIGSQPRLVDWQPTTNAEIWSFHREAIHRLLTYALNHGDPLALRARDALGNEIRGLINSIPFEEVESYITAIISQYGFWPKALQELNEWLFFDRKRAPIQYAEKVRGLFDKLMPNDSVGLAKLYTEGWQTDFHDPDVDYDKGKSDHDYASRQAVAQVPAILADARLLDRTLTYFVSSGAKTAFSFARALSELANDPIKLFADAVGKIEATDKSANVQFFSGLIAGADNRGVGRECVRMALESGKLKTNAIAMIGSGKLQPSDIKLVASLLRARDIEPWQCASLSYGRGMDHLTSLEIMPLLDELADHGPDALWISLDIVSMYLYGGRTADRLLVRKIKEIILSPTLMNTKGVGNFDGHPLELLIQALANQGQINKVFARAVAKRVLSICSQKDGDLFHKFDNVARAVLRTLIKSHATEVWSEVAPLLVSKNWLVKHRIEQLTQPSSHDENGNLKAGLLFSIPSDVYLNWVRENPTQRAALVMRWLPIVTVGDEDGALFWNRALEAYVNEFGEKDGVLAQLATRFLPRAFWGPLGRQLEPLLPLLKKWRSHPSRGVREWATGHIEKIKNQIAESNRETDEDVVRHG